MLKETIVVEGKSDLVAVRKAVDANIIITGGMGFKKETMELIRVAQNRCGVIVLTDPDSAGETIRRIISQKVRGVKHAFIPMEEARAKGDIGVENASPQSILKALSMARSEVDEPLEAFKVCDLMTLGLTGSRNSTKLRDEIGKILGIGYCGAKQFAKRLNIYGITEEEFKIAFEKARSDRGNNEV